MLLHGKQKIGCTGMGFCTYCAGNVLGGIPRYIEGLLRAVAAVTSVHTGKRLQNI